MPAWPRTTFLSKVNQANHIVPSKFWKVDLDYKVTCYILDPYEKNTGKALWPLTNVRLRAAKVRFRQILEYSTLSITLAKERKELRKRYIYLHYIYIPRAYESCLACQHFISKLLIGHTTQIKQWERNVVLSWAGICGKGQNMSSPKNSCMGGG